MVNPIQALFFGALQGATEFLPVSSSGHLVLIPWLLGLDAPGLTFDAVVHWGTAAAVIAYFWRDWLALLHAITSAQPGSWSPFAPQGDPAIGSGTPRESDAQPSPGRRDARMLWLILVGTVPAALAGYFLQEQVEVWFSRPIVAARFLLLTAVVLAASERLGRRERDLRDAKWSDALLVGLAQALAILPGISRSGVTIAAALGLGLRREAAARFSFLLSTPVILGAGLLKVMDLIQAGELAEQVPGLAIGFLAAGVVGFGCIHLLLRYLQRRRLYPFAIYCAAVGVVFLTLLAI